MTEEETETETGSETETETETETGAGHSRLRGTAAGPSGETSPGGAAAPAGRAAAPLHLLPDTHLHERLLALLREAPASDSPEASLRVGADGAVRGGRMMLERAPSSLAWQIAGVLGLTWDARMERVAAACDVLEMPLITGWDVGTSPPRMKLYVNAADASADNRRTLAARLGLPATVVPPDIVGVNISSDAVETKLYLQRPSLAELRLTAVVPDALSACDAVAWVASYDFADGGVALRAVFAAPRHGEEGSAEEALHASTGVTWSQLAARFPFEPGPLRQIGWSPGSGAMTVYAKPRGAARPVHALSPLAVFRAGDAEVGVYVTPSEDTPRAFARTAAHAIELRTREGRPAGPSLELLGHWAMERVKIAERAGRPVDALDLAGDVGDWKSVEV